MKTRDWVLISTVLALGLAAGCVDYKKKYLEADARANQAQDKLNELNATIEGLKAENAKLQAALKLSREQLAELRADAAKTTDQLKEQVRQLQLDLAVLKDKLSSTTSELQAASAKAKMADELNAKVQQLTEQNQQLQAQVKRLQAAIERIRPQPEPNVPAAR